MTSGMNADPTDGLNSGDPFPQAIIDSHGWKLLIGTILQNITQSPLYPTNTTISTEFYSESLGICADTEEESLFPRYDPLTERYNGACLYNVFTDPSESNNVASLYPDIVKRLSLRLFQLNATTWYNDRGTFTDISCVVSTSSWRGALGPFIMNSIPFVPFS